MLKKCVLSLGLITWLLVACFGFIKVYDYMNRPGEAGEPPLIYPRVSSRLLGKRPKILFFAHPKCPCSEAALTELSKLLARLEGKVDVDIVFHRPSGSSIEWDQSNLWARAKKLNNANTLIDTDGKLVELFKPKTSGQVYLYSTSRDLIYSGGITSSRGHEGDNTGSSAILDWVLHKKLATKVFSVFGCTLFHDGFSHDT
jgi:hypothetical protein